MGLQQFKRTQIINKPIEKIWEFISNPKNLKKITPKDMGFEITSENLENRIYSGMIISYKVSPLFGIKMNWVTEITNVEENKYFVDEQRLGPYKLWHHQHILNPTKKGVEMTDIVSYIPPFGFLGNLTNKMIIKRKLNDIFDYRKKVLDKEFNVR